MNASIDRASVAALTQRRIGSLVKGMPVDVGELTFAALAEQRRDLLGGGFSSPLLALDRTAFETNLAAMARWCAEHGVSLAPHGKTTMAPALWARQLDAGAWGITVANIAQARVARAFGVATVVIANELVDAAGLGWIAAEMAADPHCRFLFWVDSVAGVHQADAALRAAGASRPVDVLVEIGTSPGRGGCRDADTGEQVARAVAECSALRLTGVSAFEGVIGAETVAGAVAGVDLMLGRMHDLVLRLAKAGLFAGSDEVVVSAGGSAYFDRVVEVLGDVGAGLDVPSRLLLRSGCYLTHDEGMYSRLAPCARGVPGAPDFTPALRAWGQVCSRPEPGLALLTMGRRDVSYDAGLPAPRLRRRPDDGVPAPLHDMRVTALNDQHAFVELPEDADLDIGDWVGCGISHPCTSFERWQAIPVVEGTTVVDFVHTFF